MAKKQTPENLVMESVCEYLTYTGYTFFRLNTTPIFDVTRQVFRKMPKYAVAGVSDLVVLKNGKAIFCELKSAKGVLSDSQKNFKQMVENAGCAYFVIRSIDDIVLHKI